MSPLGLLPLTNLARSSVVIAIVLVFYSVVSCVCMCVNVSVSVCVFVEVVAFRGSFSTIRLRQSDYLWHWLDHVAVGLERPVIIHITGTYSVLNDMKLTRDREGNLSFARCIGAGAFSGCIGAFAASPMYMVSLLGPLLFLQLRRFQIV